MLLRRKNIKYRMNRAWKKINRGSVILQKYEEAEDDGFLNSAKKIKYEPYEIKNCGINLNPSKKETYAGVSSDCDAVVYLPLPLIVLPGDTDLVNIGGSLTKDGILGGDDYTISDIDRPDSMFEEEFLLRLELKLAP